MIESEVKLNVPCPRCRERGGDRTGDHMYHQDKRPGTYKCRKCGFFSRGVPDSMQQSNQFQQSGGYKEKTTLSALNMLSSGAIPERRIRASIAEAFGVKLTASETYGLDVPEKHHYPYFDRKGKLVAYKTRVVDDKTFFWTGNRKSIGLFGQGLCTGDKRLVVVEGEEDCLAAYQMLDDYLQSRYQGRGYKPCVVSLPDGASISGVPDNIDFFDRFEEIILCLDNDGPGQEAAQKIAFELSRPNIKIAKLEEKDASDMLINGKQSSFISAIFRAEPWSPPGFGSVTLEEINVAYDEGCVLPFPGLHNKIHGLRVGEVTVVTAAPGAGKSTFVREIGISLMQDGYKTAHIFLEETKRDTAKTYIAMLEKESPGRFKIKPSIISDEAKEKWIQFLNERGTFHDSFGSMEVDQLMRKLRYCVKVEKCQFIILDHISIIISGQDGNTNERKEIDLAMTRIASFAVEHGVGVVIVSHLSKNKEKSWGEGAVPSLEDLRGSMALGQLAFNVIALARNVTDDVTPNIATLWVLKNRAFGLTGRCDTLNYDHSTGRLFAIPDSYQEHKHKDKS